MHVSLCNTVTNHSSLFSTPVDVLKLGSTDTYAYNIRLQRLCVMHAVCTGTAGKGFTWMVLLAVALQQYCRKVLSLSICVEPNCWLYMLIIRVQASDKYPLLLLLLLLFMRESCVSQIGMMCVFAHSRMSHVMIGGWVCSSTFVPILCQSHLL